MAELDLDALELDAQSDLDIEGYRVLPLIKQVRQMKQALIAAAIPLEALNMDNSNGAKWMAPSVKQHVAEAVSEIRAALFVVEEK